MTSVVGRDITNTISSLSQPGGLPRDGRPESGPSDADFKPVPVPQLLAWVGESFSDRPEVLAAAVRCSAALASVGLSGGHSESAAAPASRRLFSVAGSKESMSLIIGAASSSHPSLAAVAAVALWVMVHCSSQALANAKALVAPSPLSELVAKAVGRRADGPYASHAARARSTLMELLSGAVQSV